MHVRRPSQLLTAARAIALAIGLAISLFTAAQAAAATSGVTTTSSTSVQFWVHDAPWADIHYQINGGTQLNFQVTPNGTNHTWDVTGIAAGAVVRYFFTIGNSTGGATDTAWTQFTIDATGGGGSS